MKVGGGEVEGGRVAEFGCGEGLEAGDLVEGDGDGLEGETGGVWPGGWLCEDGVEGGVEAKEVEGVGP